MTVKVEYRYAVVELNGINAGVSSGLVMTAPSCVVRGLIINRFSGNGIAVTGNGNIIEGNFIGTNATGSFALGNGQDGVFISTSSSNLIGGTTAAARNLLSGNRNGVQIFGVGIGNQVRGNAIGTNSSGTLSLGNSINGVLILGDDMRTFINDLLQTWFPSQSSGTQLSLLYF